VSGYYGGGEQQSPSADNTTNVCSSEQLANLPERGRSTRSTTTESTDRHCSFVRDSCYMEQFSWHIEQFDDDNDGSGGECE
jgi:hypothetical protein